MHRNICKLKKRKQASFTSVKGAIFIPKIHTEKENNKMSRETYNYKRQAIKTAKELFYPNSVILRLQSATTESEIARIMKTARTQED